MLTPQSLKRMLWLYLGGTKGGPVRLHILLTLKDRPSNTNQLATRMGMDYTTIMYHLRVLEKNRLVQMEQKKYGSVYFLSPILEQNKQLLEEMAEHLGKDLKQKKGDKRKEENE